MTDELTPGAGSDDILALSNDELNALPDGLELDAQQAGEIKSIFLTTLPQYLEPVAEMLDQLFADASNAEAQTTLHATLASLTTAAARIGVEEARKRLQGMCDLVASVDNTPGPVAAELQEQLQWQLAELRRLSQGDAPLEDRSPTLVSVLSGHEAIDGGVLRRLTAAGVVTVEQMLMARPDEVVAVSGLDAATVQRILAVLAERRAGASPASAPPARPPQASPPQASPTPSADNVVELRLDEQSLRTQLEAALKGRVDTEAAYTELLGEVQHRRQRSAELRRSAEMAGRRASELRRQLEIAERELQASAAQLRDLRRQRDERKVQREALDEQIRVQEGRILDLRQQGEVMREDQAQFDDAVGSLVRDVARMLKIARGE